MREAEKKDNVSELPNEVRSWVEEHTAVLLQLAIENKLSGAIICYTSGNGQMDSVWSASGPEEVVMMERHLRLHIDKALMEQRVVAPDGAA